MARTTKTEQIEYLILCTQNEIALIDKALNLLLEDKHIARANNNKEFLEYIRFEERIETTKRQCLIQKISDLDSILIYL